MDYESNEIQCNREGFNLDNHIDGYDPIYHPWRRYFARMFDTTIISIVFSFFGLFNIAILKFLKIGSDNIYLNILFGILSFIAPFLYNSIFISSIGTTPGKTILGIKVINKDGEYLSFSEALKREFYLFFYVYFLPFICVLLPLALHYFTQYLIFAIIMVFSFFVALFYPLYYQSLCLKRGKKTSYDSKIQCNVMCEEISAARMIFAFVLFVTLPFLMKMFFSLLVFLLKQ